MEEDKARQRLVGEKAKRVTKQRKFAHSLEHTKTTTRTLGAAIG